MYATNPYFLYYLFREIFVQGTYYCDFTGTPKRIVDCGANIGMSVLYFKWVWPDVEIDCFEPDPTTFAILQKNIDGNQLHGVRAYMQAVSDHAGTLDFYTHKEHAGSPKMSAVSNRVNPELFTKISVEAINLATFLAERDVDILKMDIEAGECVVFPTLSKAGLLNKIKHLFIEYHHNIPGEQQSFSDFIQGIEDAGKAYTLESHAPRGMVGAYQDILISAGSPRHG